MDNVVATVGWTNEPAARTYTIPEAGESTRPCGACGARGHGVCGAVAHGDLPRLAAAAAIANVSRGQTFIPEGAPAGHFYILIQGSAQLYKLLPDGRRQIIGFANVGSFLGVSALETYAWSAEAIEPVRMCRLSRPGLIRLLGESDAMRRGCWRSPSTNWPWRRSTWCCSGARRRSNGWRPSCSPRRNARNPEGSRRLASTCP